VYWRSTCAFISSQISKSVVRAGQSNRRPEFISGWFELDSDGTPDRRRTPTRGGALFLHRWRPFGESVVFHERESNRKRKLLQCEHYCHGKRSKQPPHTLFLSLSRSVSELPVNLKKRTTVQSGLVGNMSVFQPWFSPIGLRLKCT